MAKLVWDKESERLYETGVKNGVLYPIQSVEKDHDGFKTRYSKAVAWNGLTGVTESPEGAEATDLYADDTKYLTLRSAETFGATIEAYMYPDEFMDCDGSASLVDGVTIGQQSRKSFGMCYKTTVGNDTEGNDFGYKLHIIYGCSVSPSSKDYKTINDSPEAITFSWELKTTPVSVAPINGQTFKPTATVVINSTQLDSAGKAKLAKLEEVLYGTDSEEGYLPLPDEIASIMGVTASQPQG